MAFWFAVGGAAVFAVLMLLLGASGALALAAFAPLIVLVVAALVYRRSVGRNRPRVEALLPSLQRHLSGSTAAWVLGAVQGAQPVVTAGARELVLVRDRRVRVRVVVLERDEPAERVSVVSAAPDASDLLVETFRFGHTQERLRAPDAAFYDV
jgi:hypothetical protein